MDNCKTAGVAGRPTQEPISHEVMNVLDRIANASEKLACRAADKLHPICQSACPSTEGCDKVAREYPPLFNDMRSKLDTIENSLESITDVLDRAEV